MLVAVITVAVAARRLVLVAQKPIQVDSYPVPSARPVRSMQAGQRASVLSCDDLKSYPAIHVRLADGGDGYVIDGSFVLESVPIWRPSNGAPISFFCP